MRFHSKSKWIMKYEICGIFSQSVSKSVFDTMLSHLHRNWAWLVLSLIWNSKFSLSIYYLSSQLGTCYAMRSAYLNWITHIPFNFINVIDLSSQFLVPGSCFIKMHWKMKKSIFLSKYGIFYSNHYISTLNYKRISFDY